MCPQESLNSFKFIIYSVKIGMKTSKPILENHKIVWKALLAITMQGGVKRTQHKLRIFSLLQVWFASFCLVCFVFFFFKVTLSKTWSTIGSRCFFAGYIFKRKKDEEG